MMTECQELLLGMHGMNNKQTDPIEVKEVNFCYTQILIQVPIATPTTMKAWHFWPQEATVLPSGLQLQNGSGDLKVNESLRAVSNEASMLTKLEPWSCNKRKQCYQVTPCLSIDSHLPTFLIV